MVTNEMAIPYPMVLRKDENDEFSTQEMVVRAVIGCSKEWKLGGHRYEVACEIEDFGIQAAVAEDRVNDDDAARAQGVLDEIDAKLSGAKLQLQVADDGRVTNIDLEGLPSENTRERDISETLRQILSRLVVGFNLKLRKFNQLNEGKWYEYRSTLMSMPRPPEYSGGGQLGSSLLVHYLNKYKGHLVVQSIGEGLDQLDIGGVTRSFKLDLIGVSLFDPNEGFMLERVWALKGQETASSFFASGGYYNNGRIAMLGTQDKPDCGPTRVVNGSHQSFPNLPKWQPMER
jgi:hypothetical protein